jgi:hypothetical protein
MQNRLGQWQNDKTLIVWPQFQRRRQPITSATPIMLFQRLACLLEQSWTAWGCQTTVLAPMPASH